MKKVVTCIVMLMMSTNALARGQASVPQSTNNAYRDNVQSQITLPATGEVTMRTGKAVFGKSGKMEVELRNIDLDGRRIPVSGKYRQEGEGNTLAAVGAVFLAAGLMFVTGKSAVIPRGRELVAYTVSSEAFPELNK